MTAPLAGAPPMIERYMAVGSVPSMMVHPPLSNALSMTTPLMITATTGSLSGLDHFSKPILRTDDITTARLRATPLKRARGAAPMIAQAPVLSVPALSVIEDADTKRIPKTESPGHPSETLRVPPDAIIDVQVKNLFDFAKINDRDARRDSFNYWALKIPAIVGAAAATAFEAFGFGSVVIVLATLVAICTALDGARPRGLLHNVHRKASNEASLAGTTLQSGWHLVQLECADQLDEKRVRAADLLRAAHAERQRITDYVTAAEASLGSSARTA